MRFHVHTFGCRVNQADGDALAEALCTKGHTYVEEIGQADMIVVNSCTVTHRSDHDIRQFVRKIHRRYPVALIIFAGCYATRQPDALSKEDGVYAVVKGNDPNLIHEIVDGIVKKEEKPKNLLVGKGKEKNILQRQNKGLSVTMAWRGRTRPMVKVQDGCEAGCSYCIVPTVRGPSRSTQLDEVVEKVRELVEKGFREIVLTGIHLGLYGQDLDPPVSLTCLVKEILRKTCIERIRFSSIEPLEIDSEFVQVISQSQRIAPHLHIPMQSGSTSVLKRMNRPYQPADYAGVIKTLSAVRPGLALGADVIVGFPGETEVEFEETIRFIDALPLAYLHVFPCSLRPGTHAATLLGAIGSADITKRSRILREIGKRKNLAYKNSWIGKPLPGLVIELCCGKNESLVLTENYLKVIVTGKELSANTPVRVVIHEIIDSSQCRGSIE